jgi:LAS seventeen-binding protein 1/2
VNGKQGLFPSTYVEKLAHPVPTGNSRVTEKKPYKPFGAAYQGMDTPPPAAQGVNSIGLQEKEGTDDKKDKFGQYKSTVKDFHFLLPDKPYSIYSQLAHSAAGGVGFGAGKLSVYLMND